MYRSCIAWVNCVIVCCVLMLPAVTLAQAPDRFDIERIEQATVFLLQVEIVNDELITKCAGTGTLVRPEGIILTNAHHTVPNESCDGDTIIVSLSTDPTSPPLPRFRAEVIQSNIGLDLALLKITRELDGRLIDPDNFPPFPFVDLADSADIALDDTITVVGYPTLGNDAIQAVRGTITGFIAEPSGGDKSWMKTSAVIPSVMSGGGVYDRDGRLVAIPTAAPSDFDSSNVTCQLIDDTNRDGIINAADTCVPIGAPITALRPAEFARPLIRAAAIGLDVEIISRPSIEEELGGEPEFNRLFFTSAINNDLPTSVVGRLPAGTSSLFLVFDYENLTPETVYELRVTIDGVPDQTFGLSPVRWSGGRSGLWYIGSANQPFPNGIYEYRLFVDGRPAGSQQIEIGGVPENQPSFSNVVFGIEDALGQSVFANGYVLPADSVIRARFIYQNMVAGTPWTALWFYNGEQIPGARQDTIWEGESSGSETTALRAENGLAPGNYRLELYVDNRLSATGDFVIAGALDGVFPRVFSDTHFAQGSSPQQAILAPAAREFPDGVDVLYTLFDWEAITPGTLWTLQLSVDGDPFYSQTQPWRNPQAGDNFLMSVTAPGGLPDGTYTVDLLINGVQLAQESTEVGIGQLPIDTFALAEGIQLRGQIVDAETGEGIVGATFILISEDFSIEDFVWDQTQIYSSAVSDRNGFFQLDRSLELDSPYSVMVAVDGYVPISVDGFELSDTAESPVENPLNLVIPMTRD